MARHGRCKTNLTTSFRSHASFANPLAGLVWAHAKANSLEADSDLLRRCWQEQHVFSQNDLQCAVWAVGTLRSAHAPLLEVLACRFISTTSNQRCSTGLGNVFWVLSRSGSLEKLPELEIEALRSLPLLGTRDLAGMAWACAATRYSGQSFMEALAEMCALHYPRMAPRYLANTFWAFAKCLIQWPKEDFERFWIVVTQKMPQFRPEELAALAWAAAKVNSKSRGAIPLFHQRARFFALHGELGPQELSNLLWSFASLSSLEESTFEVLLQEVIVHQLELQAQHIANLLWTLAFTRYSCTRFLEVAREYCTNFPQKFSHLELVSIAWSFAKLDLHQILDTAQILTYCAGELHSKELTGRTYSNLLWALAVLSMPGMFEQYGMQSEIISLTKRTISSCKPQEISSIAWALVKLNASSKPVMDILVAHSQNLIVNFNPQNVTNFCWALAVESLADCDLWPCLRSFVVGRLKEFKSQELSNLCWSFAVVQSHSDCLMVADALEPCSDIRGLLAMTWALNHLQVSERNLETVRAALRNHGQKLDAQHDVQFPSLSLPPAVGHEHELIQEDNGIVSPHISLELLDRLVVSKPPGWEVEETSVKGGPSRNLCSFLRSLGRSRQARSRILHDSSHHYGFIHRLDIPSSGLILASKSYEAFYDLQFQLNSGRVSREYLLLCHGWCLSERRIEEAIRTQKGQPSRVGFGGKPSVTQLTPIARCSRKATGQTFTLMLVHIHTGRTHQIRAHTAHLGHPTVCDGKYTSATTFQEDCQWCPRNFLHRHRLVFLDRHGHQVEVTERLPLDLQMVLKELEPHQDGWSPEAWMTFLAHQAPLSLVET
eukprot:symbB.v1.2.005779.t1/scaffold289.1/size287290/24